MRKSMILAAVVVSIAASGCKKAGPAGAPVTDAEAAQIVNATYADYTSGDAGRIASHYAKGAVAFDPGHVDSSNDPTVLKGWADEFVSMQPGDLSSDARTVQLLGPDAFVSSEVAHFTVAAGAARPKVGVRITQVYQRQNDGSWKIVHEHMSMPPTPAGATAQ